MRASDIYFVNYGSCEIVAGRCAHYFPPHFHHSDCLISLTSGRLDIVLANRKMSLNPGEKAFIPRLTSHALCPVDGESYSYITMCFSKDLCLGQKTDEPPLEAELTPSDDRHKFSGRGYQHKAAEFIAKHQDFFDLKAVCDHCHVSKFHLIRQFRRCFGLTPHQYFDNLRIGKIRQGLLSGEHLSDLAYCLGFADQSHMCRTFKKYMAVTPLQFKKSYLFHPKAGEKTANM